MATILIIEDDPFVQRMYQRLFGHKNYSLEITSTGEIGLQLAERKKPDLILLDIMLPGINGLQVLEKLKSNPVTKAIQVLMLTNLGDDLIMEKAKALGADAYMVKADFSPTEVVAIVDKHLAA